MIRNVAALWAMILAALLPMPPCPAQAGIPTAQLITPTASRAIDTPIFPYYGESECDRDGNLYFHSGDSGFRFAQVFKLGSDGSTGKFLQPTGRFADPGVAEFDSFWVGEEGEVSVLVGGAGHAYLIQFDGDGAMKDPLTLQVPEDAILTDLALFDGGYMFVAGHYGHKNASHRQGQGYQAILTPSGEVLLC